MEVTYSHNCPYSTGIMLQLDSDSSDSCPTTVTPRRSWIRDVGCEQGGDLSSVSKFHGTSGLNFEVVLLL